MAATARPMLEALLVKERYWCANRYYGQLIQSARRELPPAIVGAGHAVGACASLSASADAIRQAFLHSLRQGWAAPSVLAALDRSSPPNIFCNVWIEVSSRMYTATVPSPTVQICLGRRSRNALQRH